MTDYQDLKEALSFYGRAQAARVLTQMDRDPDSPLMGCFDRNHWHYKIRDFSSAILQQGVFTVEACAKGLCGFGAEPEAIRSWRLAAINGLARQVDKKGRVNEYYPYEDSFPAGAFGLYAACRTLLDWRKNEPDLLVEVDWPGIGRLARAMAARREPYALNQQAAALAGLAMAAELDEVALDRSEIGDLADWFFSTQHEEGWFPEYGGPDFGYLTVTLDVLADYLEVTGDERARRAMDRAVGFLAGLVGADGRLPHTLNSRNTDYVTPYGLVRAGAWNPAAAWLVVTLFNGLADPAHPLWATDDRYHCHYIYGSVLRAMEHVDHMLPAKKPELPPIAWLPGCGYLSVQAKDGSFSVHIAAKKGGLVRVHRKGLTPLCENGWRIRGGKHLWTSNWWSEDLEIKQIEQGVRIKGHCHKAAPLMPSPFKHMALRLISKMAGARIIPLLKEKMIFRAKQADGPFFERMVLVDEKGLAISDRLGQKTGAEAAPGPRQNLRHVASADSFHIEELAHAPGRPVSLDQPLSQTLIWRPGWGRFKWEA